MLRFSVDAGPQRANLSAVYALFGVDADPGQLPRDPARQRLHPSGRLHARTARSSAAGSSPPTSSRSSRCSCSRTRSTGSSSRQAARPAARASCGERRARMTHRREVRHRRVLRRLRARPRLRRDHRAEAAAARARGRRSSSASAERRRWLSCSSGPRCSLYGEAAVGYFGDVRRAGAAGRAAIWGVRLGWLAQTALLAVQAAREDGFPWGTWAGSLNLFVWFVVGAYLIWGCRRRVPAARPRGDAARRRAARRRARGRRHRRRGAQPLLERSSSSSTSASCSPRSRASRSPPRCRRSTSGRSGG